MECVRVGDISRSIDAPSVFTSLSLILCLCISPISSQRLLWGPRVPQHAV